MNLQLISATATAPSTGAAGVVIAGDSLTIQNATSSSGVDIVAAWQTNQVAGFGQIAFPSGHDTTRGCRAGVPIGVAPLLLPLGFALAVQPQELLALTIAGSAVAGDVEQLTVLVRYGNMPGIAGRYIHDSELERRTDKLTTIEQSCVSTAGPSYGTPTALNAQSDLLLANRDYAVLGATSRTALHCAYMVGPDTGNTRVGVPCRIEPTLGNRWFPVLSRAHGKAMIPVVNSGNKQTTFVGVTTDENAGTFLVTWFLALLK